MKIDTEEGRQLYESFLRSFQERSELSTFTMTIKDHTTGRTCEKNLTGTELKRLMLSSKITLPDWK